MSELDLKNTSSNMAATNFMTIPKEVRCMVFQKLPTYMDSKNLCLAFPKLQWDLQDYLYMENHREAMQVLLEQPGIDPKVCRLVCKDWRFSVDNCLDAARVNFSLTNKKCKRRLVPTILVPLRIFDFERLQRVLDGDANFFLKGSLHLRFRHPPISIGRAEMDETKPLIENLQQIWTNVKHLEIDPGYAYYYKDDDRAWAFKPIMEYMNNVKRIVLNDVTHCKPVLCLPNLGKLQEIVCLKVQTNYIMHVFDDGWGTILSACQSNLKLLHVPRTDGGLFTYFQFPRLEEFAHTFGSFNGSFYPPNRKLASAISNVKVLSIECKRSDWLYVKDLTHRLKKLSYLHVRNLGPYQNIRRPWLPISNSIFANKNVQYVELEGGNDGLGSIFPDAKIRHFESVGITGLSQYNFSETDDWDLNMDRNQNFERAVITSLGKTFENWELVAELSKIASVVGTETFLKSEALWKYLGGQERISYEMYQKIGSAVNLQLREEQRIDVDIKHGMEIIERRFGSGFFHSVDYDQDIIVEAQWQAIVSNAIGSEIQIEKFNGCNWDMVLEAFQVYNQTSGRKLMQEFYSKVVPFLSVAVNFGHFGMKTGLNLDPSSRNAMIAIYHFVLDFGDRMKWNKPVVIGHALTFMMGHRIIPNVCKNQLVQDFKENCRRDDAAVYFCVTAENLAAFRQRFGC